MQAGLNFLQRVSLGLLSIVAAGTVLIWADRDSRVANIQDIQSRLLNIAIVQHASIPALNDGVEGIIEALDQRGYITGKNIEISRYNPEGDFATANTIAKTVTTGNADLIATVSTVSLQTIAAANRQLQAPKPHVFSLTTDPFSAGVGISREHPLAHPAYMAGLGSSPPIRELFQLTQRVNPSVHRIGLVWNPAEANSEAAALEARAVAADLGLELVEGNAENSTMAGEVVYSILSRGVDLIWISTDVTISSAEKVIIKAAENAGVPVISSLPDSVNNGALMAMGSSYYDIGFQAGQLVADLLEGRDPASIPAINWTPSILALNLNALTELKQPWEISDDIKASAKTVIDASGRHHRDVPLPNIPASLRWQR